MAVTWNLLPLGVQRECAGCGNPAAYEMESGGRAEDYCRSCREESEAREHLDRSLRARGKLRAPVDLTDAGKPHCHEG